MKTLSQLAADLASGRTTSRALVEDCLARIEDPSGEGRRVFIKVAADRARVSADYHDQMRRHSAAASPYAGIPLSIKDLFDMTGEVTTAGSVVLRDTAPATEDAFSVARLKNAGFVPIGRTNMTEFAFSALGINPHYGTPRNAFDRKAGRIPGGSSSGAAVSLTDGMALAALGSDTGGSSRIPAALCGIVGFKPTARRVSLKGAVPLSTTLDSVGPLGVTVECCAILDQIMSGEQHYAALDSVSGLRLAVPQTLMLDGLDPYIEGLFDSCLRKLSDAGAKIIKVPLRELTEIPQINAKGGFAAPEAFAYHRALIATKSAQYDPRVLSRIMRGKEQDAADYVDLIKARTNFIRRISPIMAQFDAVVLPTVATGAPRLADLEVEEEYFKVNLRLMRNTGVANFIDGCAISIPCHKQGETPAGFMVMGAHNTDQRLLSIAAAIENLVSPRHAD